MEIQGIAWSVQLVIVSSFLSSGHLETQLTKPEPNVLPPLSDIGDGFQVPQPKGFGTVHFSNVTSRTRVLCQRWCPPRSPMASTCQQFTLQLVHAVSHPLLAPRTFIFVLVYYCIASCLSHSKQGPMIRGMRVDATHGCAFFYGQNHETSRSVSSNIINTFIVEITGMIQVPQVGLIRPQAIKYSAINAINVNVHQC